MCRLPLSKFPIPNDPLLIRIADQTWLGPVTRYLPISYIGREVIIAIPNLGDFLTRQFNVGRDLEVCWRQSAGLHCKKHTQSLYKPKAQCHLCIVSKQQHVFQALFSSECCIAVLPCCKKVLPPPLPSNCRSLDRLFTCSVIRTLLEIGPFGPNRISSHHLNPVCRKDTNTRH